MHGHLAADRIPDRGAATRVASGVRGESGGRRRRGRALDHRRGRLQQPFPISNFVGRLSTLLAAADLREGRGRRRGDLPSRRNQRRPIMVAWTAVGVDPNSTRFSGAASRENDTVEVEQTSQQRPTSMRSTPPRRRRPGRRRRSRSATLPALRASARSRCPEPAEEAATLSAANMSLPCWWHAIVRSATCMTFQQQRHGRIPLPSFIFEMGLWTIVVPDSRTSSMSPSVSQIPCSKLTRGPRKPSARRCSGNVLPYIFWPAESLHSRLQHMNVNLEIELVRQPPRARLQEAVGAALRPGRPKPDRDPLLGTVVALHGAAE